MAENKKTALSGATSYREIGEYWDRHDLAEHADSTNAVELEVDIQSSVVYFALEKSLAARLRSVARRNNVSAENLLSEWVQQHVGDEPAVK
jgi:CopG antitoxin of type II toxin-antitoxin system